MHVGASARIASWHGVRLFHPEGPSLWELTVQAMSSVEDGYDRLAARFDRTPFRTPDAIIDAALDGAGPIDGLRALDLCTGTGAAAIAMASRGASVVGADASSGMLAVAAKASDGVTWRKLDVLALPSDWEGRFDVVTCFGAFGHFEKPELKRLLENARRALAPGGRFIFVTTKAPPLASVGQVVGRTFNAVMKVRNALWKPPFVMYYLRFFVDEARAELEATGFDVEVSALGAIHPRLFAVVATAC